MGARFVAGSMVIALLSAATVVIVALHILRGTIPGDPLPPLAPPERAGPAQTILVLGSDRRYGDRKAGKPVRSDTMMVVRLDPDRDATAVMSIPRDLRVRIPGHGTDKINAAYSIGGATLAVKTVTELGIGVNHVVGVGFGGFQRAVNRLGCVYVDVDRRYFNDNRGGPGGYATIDIQPGYQRLCGSDALDFVRFRHLDDDVVRGARQQEFLRQAKDQIATSKLIEDRSALLKILGDYTESDLAGAGGAAIVGVLKLAYHASKQPVSEVAFPTSPAPGGAVEISQSELRKAIHRFEHPTPPPRARPRAQGSKPKPKPKPQPQPRADALAAGLVAAREQGENHVLVMATKLRGALPVYLPRARLAAGGYASDSPRSYVIADATGKRHRAYRIVLSQGDAGQHYGVQGTTWRNPPILDDPTDTVPMRGRRYMRYFDGGTIRLIAWRTERASYWVSNTLSRRLSNAQMMGIARSLGRIA